MDPHDFNLHELSGILMERGGDEFSNQDPALNLKAFFYVVKKKQLKSFIWLYMLLYFKLTIIEPSVLKGKQNPSQSEK